MRAATPNYYKVGGLKQQEFMLLQLGKLEFKNQDTSKKKKKKRCQQGHASCCSREDSSFSSFWTPSNLQIPGLEAPSLFSMQPSSHSH